MARGRMVNKKISVSYRVNKLPGDAPLLYVFLIAHLDCEGRYFGDSAIIKGQILPLRKANAKKIDEWLNEMEASLDDETGLPLLFRYEVGGNKYLEMPGFTDEQIGLRKDKESPEYPAPPEEILRKIYGNNTENIRQNDGNNPPKVPPNGKSNGKRSRTEREVEENIPPIPPLQSKRGTETVSSSFPAFNPKDELLPGISIERGILIAEKKLLVNEMNYGRVVTALKEKGVSWSGNGPEVEDTS